MSSLFAQVFEQACVTFKKDNTGEKFLADLQTLKNLVEQLSLSDLNINPRMVSPKTFRAVNKAPTTCIDLFENECFMMSVFVMRNNYTMPLHDHPRMHGIMRVISGTAKVRSYSEISRTKATIRGVQVGQILTEAMPEKMVTAQPGESVHLTPKAGNFHEITAYGGPVAFLDILGPPYSCFVVDKDSRLCSFYRPMPNKGNSSNGANQPDGEQRTLVTLQQIPMPKEHSCDSEYYKQPDFMLASKMAN